MATHPYLQEEMLNKSFNRFTTRSNTFAVFMTIAFFEVESRDPPNDPQGRPVLGQEFFVDNPKDSRFKFFAVLDRSNMTIALNPANPKPEPGGQPIFFRAEGGAPWTTTPTNPATIEVPVPGFGTPTPTDPLVTTEVTGDYDGTQWVIRVGQQIYAGAPGHQEPVTVSAIRRPSPNDPWRLQILCNRPHPGGFAVCTQLLGTPGPQEGIDIDAPELSGIVRYFARLE